LLTDAASLKVVTTAEVTARLGARGLDPARFVGGHPMAGSERSGPEAADAQLFQGATWILTPTAATADATLTRVAAFLRTLGARVVALAPDRHDELVAVVSHLPQVVASSLAAVAADAIEATGDAVLAVAGGGFRDTTRIAASDPRLWIEILAGNRDAVLEALDAYAATLDRARAAVAGRDWAALEALLARASTARQRLVPKATPAEVADVVVPLDDRPGQLAAATTALGAAGINVEDLALRHAGDGGRGALLVQVAATDLGRALEVLAAAGLAVHVEPGT
jgi:prephenate dehydrogenase